MTMTTRIRLDMLTLARGVRRPLAARAGGNVRVAAPRGDIVRDHERE